MRIFWPLGVILLLTAGQAKAGMTVYTLTDVAELRLQAISFFAFAFLGLAWVVQSLWNYLRSDFPILPLLGYKKALVLILVCGLFFNLILTMISGAREIMTPGAWVRNGSTYTLKSPDEEPKAWIDGVRLHGMEKLRSALWKYAQENQNVFPVDEFEQLLPDDVWEAPGSGGLRYIYRGGASPDTGQEVVAYEPGVFGRTRYVLLSNGIIEKRDIRKIQAE